MSKIMLVVYIAVLATAFAYPAAPIEGQENELTRIVREANADPGHYKHYGHGHYGYGHGGYGHGGYGHGGYHGGHHGYGGYPHGGNSFAQSSANAGSFSSPFGSASFASAHSNAGAHGYKR